MCIFPEGGIDAVDYVEAKDNQEVKTRENGRAARSRHVDASCSVLLLVMAGTSWWGKAKTVGGVS